ncbi:hypothetical protein HYPSUDRAFT_1092187, partial [Hypholoma sublateritium FD-334 SS-4]
MAQPAQRHQIQDQDALMTLLGFPNLKVGSFASQAMSTVELPQGQWRRESASLCEQPYQHKLAPPCRQS